MTDTANPFPASSMTFAGCRTTDEAIAKLRPWLEQIVKDHERRLETGLLTDAPELDPDGLRGWLLMTERANAEVLEDLLVQARKVIEEHGLARDDDPD